ncbi:MAG: class I SAM-dependent methyltransferase [Chitinispirillaceae bacterium]|nr:class I SAM-dependent methyltransferase [Chitinispirillaceae bacterium]
MINLLNIGKKLAQENGPYWTFLYTLYWSARHFLKINPHGLYKAIVGLEERRDLPGFNTPAAAAEIWDLLPWEKGRGEEWTISAEWKKSLIDEVLYTYIKPGTAVLEIGPGAGRWTEILLPLARELSAVDVSAKAIDICKKRFFSAANIRFFLTLNTGLGFIPDKTIDAIWSFDVFVHINPHDTDGYLSEIKRVLVPGGIAVIHHPKDGGLHGGWRSRMTAQLFADLLEKRGLTLVRQFDSWGENGRFNLSRYCDCISVFHA